MNGARPTRRLAALFAGAAGLLVPWTVTLARALPSRHEAVHWNLANHSRNPGKALIGNSEPARNQGTIAIAGTRAMNSSALGTRLASVSAIPYMPIANSSVAPTNHRTPVPLAGNAAPRSAAATISTTI